eukprot:m51a1_g10793 hypothetical protein (849) ;mRNA; r:44740-51340
MSGTSPDGDSSALRQPALSPSPLPSSSSDTPLATQRVCGMRRRWCVALAVVCCALGVAVVAVGATFAAVVPLTLSTVRNVTATATTWSADVGVAIACRTGDVRGMRVRVDRGRARVAVGDVDAGDLVLGAATLRPGANATLRGSLSVRDRQRTAQVDAFISGLAAVRVTARLQRVRVQGLGVSVDRESCSAEVHTPPTDDVMIYVRDIIPEKRSSTGTGAPAPPAAIDLGDSGAGAYLRYAQVPAPARQQLALSSRVAAGDVDGDGLADLVPAALSSNTDATTAVAYVLLRASALGRGGAALPVPPPEGSGAAWAALYDSGCDANALPAIVATCDVDGDGLDDVYTGVQSSSGPARETVVFGRPAWADVDLAALDGAHGIAWQTPWLSGSEAYTCSCGDLNGDGLGDLLFQRGREVSAVLGQRGPRSGPADFSTVAVASVPAGCEASIAGDVNGDALDDVVLATLSSVTVLFGRNFTAGDYAAGAWRTFRAEGAMPRSQAAHADLDGDRLQDLVVPEPSGGFYVLWGHRGEWSDRALGANDTLLRPADPAKGRMVVGLGDVNGDRAGDIGFWPTGTGDAELVFGSPSWKGQRSVSLETALISASPSAFARLVPLELRRPGRISDFGVLLPFPEYDDGMRLAVVHGSAELAGPMVLLSDYAGIGVSLFTKRAHSESFGASVSILGDLNGDGCHDYAIGAPGAPSYGLPNSCMVSLHYGCMSSATKVRNVQTSSQYAWSAVISLEITCSTADVTGMRVKLDKGRAEITLGDVDLGEMELGEVTLRPKTNATLRGTMTMRDRLRTRQTDAFLSAQVAVKITADLRHIRVQGLSVDIDKKVEKTMRYRPEYL